MRSANGSKGTATFAHYRHFWAISVRLTDPQIIDFAHVSRLTHDAFDKEKART
jgi:hypothetical protein